MGARVYIPALGRFLQVDPVQGGTDNNYAYPTDPVNDFDLEGTFSFMSLGRLALKAVGVAAYIPGPIGMAASAVQVGVALASGNVGEAAMAASGLVPGEKLISGGIDYLLGLAQARLSTLLRGIYHRKL